MQNILEQRRIVKICFIIWGVLLSTFILSLIVSEGYSFKSLFFLRTQDFIMDFSNSIRDSSGNDVYSYFYSIYPPIAVLFFRFLSLFYDKDVIAKETSKYVMWEQPMLYIQFALFMLICIFIIAFSIKRKCKYLSKWSYLFLFIFIILSHPFLFAIERGNIIILSAALIVFFLCCYNDKNRILHELSIIALALSIAIKMYPVVFALLLVKNKDIKSLTKAGIYTVLMYFLPFCFYDGFNGLYILITTPFKFFDASISDTNSSLRLILYHLGIIAGDGFIYKYVNYVVLIYFVYLSFHSKKQYITYLCLSLAMLHMPGAEGVYAALFLLPSLVLIFNEEKLDLMDFICLIWFILDLSVVGLFSNYYDKYAQNHINIIMMPILHFIASYLVIAKNKRPLLLITKR